MYTYIHIPASSPYDPEPPDSLGPRSPPHSLGPRSPPPPQHRTRASCQRSRDFAPLLLKSRPLAKGLKSQDPFWRHLLTV